MSNLIDKFSMKATLLRLAKEGFTNVEISKPFPNLFCDVVQYVKFNFKNRIFYTNFTTDLYNKKDLFDFLLRNFEAEVDNLKKRNISFSFKKSFIEKQCYCMASFKSDSSLMFSYEVNGYSDFINNLVNKYPTLVDFMNDLESIEAEEILSYGYEDL